MGPFFSDRDLSFSMTSATPRSAFCKFDSPPSLAPTPDRVANLSFWILVVEFEIFPTTAINTRAVLRKPLFPACFDDPLIPRFLRSFPFLNISSHAPIISKLAEAQK